PPRSLRGPPPQLPRGGRVLPAQPVRHDLGGHGGVAAHPQLPPVLRGGEALQRRQATRALRIPGQAPAQDLRRRVRRARSGLARRHGAHAAARHARPATSKVAKALLSVAGREVAISNPGKVLFPKAGHTKLDLARYYLAVADGALRGAGGRPNVLVRYPDGIEGEFFFQKRAPASRPDWIEVAAIHFPSGREAEEVVPRDAAALAWLANMACLELHPHPVRAEDLDHPDELRVDLDPVPGVNWKQVLDVAQVAHSVLDDFKLLGWPKTSGKRGLHICVRIEPRWGFDDVRRAALALAREVERRVPKLATSKWWKEERHGVFVDYNQNAKDRTVASAYSVRPMPDARVSAPLAWDEVPDCDPADFTLATMPVRFEKLGDLHAEIDQHRGSLEGLLQLFEKQGQGDAPWPPQYRKQAGEPPRVQPSRRKMRPSS